jgi:hypothetical protein
VGFFGFVIDLGCIAGSDDLTAIADIRRRLQLVAQIWLIVWTHVSAMIEETASALV